MSSITRRTTKKNQTVLPKLCYSDSCEQIIHVPQKYNQVFGEYYCDSCLSCYRCKKVIKDGGVDVKNIVQGSLLCGECL